MIESTHSSFYRLSQWFTTAGQEYNNGSQNNCSSAQAFPENIIFNKIKETWSVITLNSPRELF